MTLPPLPLNAWLRYDVIRRHLRRLADVSSVLEIGAGQGAVGARLAIGRSYVGVEPDRRSAAVATRRVRGSRRDTLIVADIAAVPGDSVFDLVCAFEVMEHIEDDAGALREWRSHLREGGRLLLSVPAFQRRFGPWDREVGHYRRYDRPQLAALITSAGFSEPVVEIYGFPLGYLLEWARNRLAARRAVRDSPSSMEQATARSGRTLQPPESLAWATRLATAPFRAMQRPFASSQLGTGFVVLARRAE